MHKLAFPLSLIAVALLAACATEERATPAPAPVVIVPQPAATPPVVTTAPAVVVPTPTALRPGSGRVEAISALPPSAAAGGSTPSSNKRVGIKMDDGTVQYLDTDAAGLAIGDRIEITKEGTLRR